MMRRSHVTLDDPRALAGGGLVRSLRVVGELKGRPPVADREVVLRHGETVGILLACS